MSTERTNITFVLYEGKHDAAILTRLLRLNGYSEFKDKAISEFPTKLKGYFESKIKGFIYEDETNIFQKPQLPNHICKSKDGINWFVFYEMGGDSKKKFVLDIIKELKNETNDFTNEEKFDTDSPVSLAFFFDADDDILKRKKSFIADYSTLLTGFTRSIETTKSREAVIVGKDGFSRIGLYIYGGNDSTGTLEDIIIPIMQEGKKEMFKDANDYIDKYMSDTAKKSRSKKGKALIGVIGQPKHYGKSNQVIISDTKFITKDKLSKNSVFKSILKFLNSFTINES
ncbi:MAG: hypothetical protein N4A49_09560 [Marinifilaceae bacterium]|jgi:hypothetical protein|nr:hypothetical protein [Marinifilaceae bacterium]